MEEVVFNILNQTFGTTFAITVVTVGMSIWLTHYVTKKVTEIKSDQSSFKKSLDKSEKDIDEIRKDVSYIKGSMDVIWKSTEALKSTVDSLKGTTETLGSTVNSMKSAMDIMRKETDNQYLQSHSPVSLTDEGKKVAEEMGADAIIDKNWGVISEVLKEVDGKNAYDVQQFCINTAEERPERFFDPATIDKVKMFAFQKGKHVILFYSVLGLLIRDRYFSEHGIPLSRADD